MSNPKQLIVSGRGTPRNWVRITRALNKVKVSILALHKAPIRGRGSLVLIVENPRKAMQALTDIGFRCTEQETVQVDQSDVPEALGRVVEKMAGRKTNFTAAYRTPSKSSGKVSIVITV